MDRACHRPTQRSAACGVSNHARAMLCSAAGLAGPAFRPGFLRKGLPPQTIGTAAGTTYLKGWSGVFQAGRGPTSTSSRLPPVAPTAPRMASCKFGWLNQED